MAEMLVKAEDATAARDIGCYKRGDVVSIQEDGFAWGVKERIPPAQGGKFVIVKVPGIKPSELEADDFTKPELDEQGVMTRRRFVRVNLDAVAESETLRTEGRVTRTRQALRGITQTKTRTAR